MSTQSVQSRENGKFKSGIRVNSKTIIRIKIQVSRQKKVLFPYCGSSRVTSICNVAV